MFNQHLWSREGSDEPLHRAVFLGASNLQRTFPHAVAVARCRLGTNLQIHVVMGAGRSYGVEAGYLGKKFSGIFFCEIWNALRHKSTAPTVAFITDVGNDLGYEIEVPLISRWVAECVDRLVDMGAAILISELPLASLQRINSLEFKLLRTILFPRCRLSRDEVLRRAKHLNDRLCELAEMRKIPIFSLPNAWYGFDPIHVRRSCRVDYWRALFDRLTGQERTPMTDSRSFLLASYLRCLPSPAHRAWHHSSGDRRVEVALHDGTHVALY